MRDTMNNKLARALDHEECDYYETLVATATDTSIYANQSAQDITGADIARYQSPYTQQVVDATQAQFNNQNAQQQSQLLGNAAAQNALGGDRAAVAQANLAG